MGDARVVADKKPGFRRECRDLRQRKVVKSGAVKKSEIILDQGGIMPIEFLVFKYGKGVTALAKADFNRTRALADRFERNELRLLAQLLIVKGLLQSQN